MSWKEVVEQIENWDGEGILLLEPRDQFDPALVGLVERFHDTFALYSRKAVLESLTAEIEDDDEDYPPDLQALEHYQFNIVGGWVGSGTPGFLIDDEETP